MPKVQKGVIYTKNYTDEQLEKAIVASKQGMSKRKAAVKFGVPRATLQFRLGQKFSKTSHGPPTILTSEEENILVDWILESYRKGFPRRKEDVQVSVKQFIDQNPRKNPFKNNLPGDGWYKAFLKRHNNLVVNTSEAVTTSANIKVSENDIRGWFNKIDQYFSEENYADIVNDPSRIFNADETDFQLCSNNKRVLAPKGSKNVDEIDKDQAESNVTVLFTFSASGETTPPMIVYPHQTVSKNIINSSWYEYIENVLYPHLKKLNVQFPIIVFVNAHKSQIDRNLSDLCTKLDIVLIALYPNATNAVSAFNPLKEGWKKAVLEWRIENPMLELTKQHFAPIIERIVQNFELEKDIVRNGFRACGLYPWNVDAIDFSKYLGKRRDQNLQSEEIESISTLKFQRFAEIVGEEYIQKFQDFDKMVDGSGEDFFRLYKLWREFKCPNECDVNNGEATVKTETNID